MADANISNVPAAAAVPGVVGPALPPTVRVSCLKRTIAFIKKYRWAILIGVVSYSLVGVFYCAGLTCYVDSIPTAQNPDAIPISWRCDLIDADDNDRANYGYSVRQAVLNGVHVLVILVTSFIFLEILWVFMKCVPVLTVLFLCVSLAKGIDKLSAWIVQMKCVLGIVSRHEANVGNDGQSIPIRNGRSSGETNTSGAEETSGGEVATANTKREPNSEENPNQSSNNAASSGSSVNSSDVTSPSPVVISRSEENAITALGTSTSSRNPSSTSRNPSMTSTNPSITSRNLATMSNDRPAPRSCFYDCCGRHIGAGLGEFSFLGIFICFLITMLILYLFIPLGHSASGGWNYGGLYFYIVSALHDSIHVLQQRLGFACFVVIFPLIFTYLATSVSFGKDYLWQGIIKPRRIERIGALDGLKKSTYEEYRLTKKYCCTTNDCTSIKIDAHNGVAENNKNKRSSAYSLTRSGKRSSNSLTNSGSDSRKTQRSSTDNKNSPDNIENARTDLELFRTVKKQKDHELKAMSKHGNATFTASAMQPGSKGKVSPIADVESPHQSFAECIESDLCDVGPTTGCRDFKATPLLTQNGVRDSRADLGNSLTPGSDVDVLMQSSRSSEASSSSNNLGNLTSTKSSTRSSDSKHTPQQDNEPCSEHKVSFRHSVEMVEPDDSNEGAYRVTDSADFVVSARAIDSDDDVESDDECPICMDSFEPNDEMTFVCEKHFFHTECIKLHASMHTGCPLCRREAFSVDVAAKHELWSKWLRRLISLLTFVKQLVLASLLLALVVRLLFPTFYCAALRKNGDFEFNTKFVKQSGSLQMTEDYVYCNNFSDENVNLLDFFLYNLFGSKTGLNNEATDVPGFAAPIRDMPNTFFWKWTDGLETGKEFFGFPNPLVNELKSSNTSSEVDDRLPVVDSRPLRKSPLPITDRGVSNRCFASNYMFILFRVLEILPVTTIGQNIALLIDTVGFIITVFMLDFILLMVCGPIHIKINQTVANYVSRGTERWMSSQGE